MYRPNMKSVALTVGQSLVTPTLQFLQISQRTTQHHGNWQHEIYNARMRTAATVTNFAMGRIQIRIDPRECSIAAKFEVRSFTRS